MMFALIDVVFASIAPILSLMPARERRRGLTWERAVANELKSQGWLEAQRSMIWDDSYSGDIQGLPEGIHIECKSHKDIVTGLATGMLQAVRSANEGDIPIVVSKRPNKPTNEAYVALRLADLTRFIHWARSLDNPL